MTCTVKRQTDRQTETEGGARGNEDPRITIKDQNQKKTKILLKTTTTTTTTYYTARAVMFTKDINRRQKSTIVVTYL